MPRLHGCAGLLRAAFMTMNALVTPAWGLAATFLPVRAGQLVAFLPIDHFGWFTGTPEPARSAVLRDVGLVFRGALLVVRA